MAECFVTCRWCRRSIIICWLRRFIKYNVSWKRRGWNGCKSRRARTAQIKASGSSRLPRCLARTTTCCPLTVFRTDSANLVSVVYKLRNVIGMITCVLKLA